MFDSLITTLATYVTETTPTQEAAYLNARLSLMDALGCAILALQYPACTHLLGPVIPNTIVPNGVRVPGTVFCLDPIRAAWNIGTQIRWLDFNDTWLGLEWGHPSDNLGAILAVADYQSRHNIAHGHAPLTVKKVLEATIKAYEIQGLLALENALNRLGFDHVFFVKIASTALAMYLLGGTQEQVQQALSQSLMDSATLRAYRHYPNTGSRKSWAAGDATSRAVQLAWLTLQGEMGYPQVLTTPTWGLQDALLRGQPLMLSQPLGTYVIENVLFKIAFPAEFHAQTAVECAIQLHAQMKDRVDHIDRIIIETQESAMRIINKTGPLNNPADRDHCLQYMVSIALLQGTLEASHYENAFACDPRIDVLREKMHVTENKQFSKDYLDPQKRSIANALQIFFKDGSQTEKITIEYPIGHKRRREVGLPLLYRKFETNLATRFPPATVTRLVALFHNQQALENMAISTLMDQLMCHEHIAGNMA